jgi:outer membrane protein TolC
MRIKIIYCVAFFLLGIQNQYSQKKWSLEECINFAFQNNLNFKNNNYDYKIQKENYKQSKHSFLPSLSANSGYSINYGRSIDPNTNGYTNTSFFSNSYSLSTSLNLFGGFRKWNTIFYENYQQKAIEQSLLKAKQELKIKVLENFHEVLYTQELLKITKEQLAISKSNVKIIDTKISLGLKAKSDLYTAKSLLLSDSLAVLKAQNSVVSTKLKLIHVMNLPEKLIELQTVMHPKNNEKIVFKSSQLIVDKAFGHLPEIEEQKLLVKAAKKQLSIKKSFLLPSLNIGAGYNTGFYEARTDALGKTVDFKTQINDNASKYIRASLSIPIFSGLQKRHQIRVSKINVLKAENNLARKKQQLQQEIEATIQKSQALFLEKKMTQKNIEAKELEFVIAQKKFKSGLINLYELSQTKKEFIEVKVSLLNISFQLISTNWLLNYYQNNTLN